MEPNYPVGTHLYETSPEDVGILTMCFNWSLATPRLRRHYLDPSRTLDAFRQGLATSYGEEMSIVNQIEGRLWATIGERPKIFEEYLLISTDEQQSLALAVDA
jgi:hypothetical protein